MLVADLQHFLELPPGTPVPARRMAEHLGDIVRAGTAGDVGTDWTTALPCRRRPANRSCPGDVAVLRAPRDGQIRWHCSACNDEGVISNWQGSPFDLRRQRLTAVDSEQQIVIAATVAATLRDLRLLDADCERTVFRIRSHTDGALLVVTDDDLDELIGSVAAEANHEPTRNRRRRLDTAFDALTAARPSCVDGT